MPAMSADDVIKLWGGTATITAKLGGGTRSDVWAVQIDGRRHTLRRSRRPSAAIDWELDLVQFLASQGVGVPSVLPTVDGARTCGPFFVLSWIEGRAPRIDEWREVATTLERVHALTRSWPQRPTFASTVDLLTEPSGGDVDLSVMPHEAVEQCRDAWLPLTGEQTSAIHGDPLGNALITEDGVVLIDWDEARVDASLLDLADLPGMEEALPPAARAMARRASSAWEAAASWSLEPEYARRRLAGLAYGSRSLGTSSNLTATARERRVRAWRARAPALRRAMINPLASHWFRVSVALFLLSPVVAGLVAFTTEADFSLAITITLYMWAFVCGILALIAFVALVLRAIGRGMRALRR
jgi:hypothetical protein